MDSQKILKKLKLIETFQLDIGHSKDDVFKELKLITNRDNQHFTSSVNKSNKKYVGQVGTDFFTLKPRDEFYPKLDVCAHGKIIDGMDKTQLEIEINGFHKKWVVEFPIMFLIFAFIVLWMDNSLASLIFLCVAFLWLSFGCIFIMRFNKERFKNKLVKILKSACQ